MLFSFKNSCDVFVSVSGEALTNRIFVMPNFNSSSGIIHRSGSFKFIKNRGILSDKSFRRRIIPALAICAKKILASNILP